MGGQEILQYAALGPEDVRKQISGFLAMAPFIRLHPSSEPNRLTVVAGKFAGKLLPNWQMVSKLDSKWMCHDETICKSWEEDELCHDTGTLQGLAGMLERAEELDKGLVTIKDWPGCRVWLGHGTGDRVTHHKATSMFMEKLKVRDKTIQLYADSYHCSTCPLTPFPTHLLTAKKYILSQSTRRNLLPMLRIGFLLKRS